MSNLVNRNILEHRKTILDGLVALALTDCDHRTLYITAELFGVAQEFADRSGALILINTEPKRSNILMEVQAK